MTEPSDDWGNVRFRRRARYAPDSPEDAASARFTIGLIVFVGVALAYPWYAYWVQSRLLARDLAAGVAQVEQQLSAADAEAARRLADLQRARHAASQRARVQAVRVMGAYPGADRPTVIVQLGTATLEESGATICRQAAAWLGRPVSGTLLRVQQHRGSAPALDIGNIRC
ncbi:MAG TPA: hypothetical protein VM576_11365 [Xanthomonadaceae bacterium]|nr:hypothetical protein [Xanthomonadaceae bacterium]